MNEKELLAIITEKASPGVAEGAGEAIRLLTECNLIRKPYTQETVRQVIQFLGLRRPDKSGTKTFSISPTATDAATAEMQARKLDPEVRALRKQYFGFEEPPFNSIDEVLAALSDQQEAEGFGSIPSSIAEGAHEVYSGRVTGVSTETVKNECAIGSWLWPIWIGEMNSKAPREEREILATVAIAREEELDHPCWERAFREPSFLKVKEVVEMEDGWTETTRNLSRRIKELAEAVGWQENEMGTYFLSGIISVSPVLIKTSAGRPYFNVEGKYSRQNSTWVTVTFKSRDVSFNELLGVYKSIRRGLGLTNKKRITERDWEMYQLLKVMAPSVWDEGAMNGYKALRKAWNKSHSKEADLSDDGMRKAIERLSKKLTIEHLLPGKKHEKTNPGQHHETR